MAQIPNLDNSPLNLTAIREQSQKDLLNIVKSIRGKKCLVIDPKLAGTLSLIQQTSVLKEYGAELRILSADPLQTECPKVVYLVRAQPNYMKFIANQIKNDEPKGLQREYFLYFVPRRTVSCEKVHLSFFTFKFYQRISVFYTSMLLLFYFGREIPLC
jgi:hypothetical protein